MRFWLKYSTWEKKKVRFYLIQLLDLCMIFLQIINVQLKMNKSKKIYTKPCREIDGAMSGFLTFWLIDGWSKYRRRHKCENTNRKAYSCYRIVTLLFISSYSCTFGICTIFIKKKHCLKHFYNIEKNVFITKNVVKCWRNIL